ncbi:MAG: hypothetical protein GY851_18060 [bacterium]|nr:hypothetical protein [bacterium]
MIRRFRPLAMALVVAVTLTSAPGCYTVVGIGKDVVGAGRIVGKIFGVGKKDKDKEEDKKKDEKRD